MSLENPLGLARSSKVESPETKKALDAFRSKMLGALVISMSAFLQACGGLSKEDMEKMPTTSLEEVIKNPEAFAQMPLVKIEGYPVMVSKEDRQYPIPKFDKDGNLTRFDYITKNVDCYEVHATSDLKSPAMRACADGTMLYVPYLPLTAQNEKLAPRLHHVVGKVEKESLFKKDGKYILDIQGAIDREAPQSAKK